MSEEAKNNPDNKIEEKSIEESSQEIKKNENSI